MPFLEQYDAAAVEERWPLTRDWLDHRPLELFAELREQRPVLDTPECVLFARYVDVIEILRQPKTFTVELYVPAIGEFMLAQDDTPLHTREKAVMHSMLNRDDIAKVRKLVGDQARQLLDAANGHLDLGQEYSRLVPIDIVQQYFGLDGEDKKKMIGWSYSKQLDAFRNQTFLQLDDRDTVRRNSDQAGQEIAAFLGQLLGRKGAALKEGKAGDDIVTRLLQTQFPNSVNFPIPRAARNAGGLLVGTIETTSQAVLQCLRQLFKRPDVLARAVKAAQSEDTTEFDGIVWEALRWDPVAPFVFRLTAHDQVVAGGTARETRVPKGKVVLALLQSAMFDPELFPHPEQFDSTRPFETYMHFGWGTHECLGKHVGMVLIPEMVRQLLLRPGVKPDAELDFGGTPYPQHYMMSWNGNGAGSTYA
ncbi:MAG TPA: cytochrome P450 [Thermoanaerobaculia bacterium]